MRDFWYNLRYRPDGTRIAFSTHLFFFITLMFGLAFVLPPDMLAGATHLFQFSPSNGIPVIWGTSLLVVSIMNTVMLATRSKTLGAWTGVLGFCCWLYAAIAYAMDGFYLGLIVGALPNMAFWAWYYMRTQYFKDYLR